MDNLKKRKTCQMVMAAIMLVLGLIIVFSLDYRDDMDWLIALMFIGVPVLTQLFIVFTFKNYDKFYTNGKFIFTRMLLSFAVNFVIESLLILIVFGITRPQYKLFVFALAFSVIAFILTLILSGIFTIVAKEKKNRQ